ncbi:MAG: type I restriction enzyme endonuclease domain-containing protein, partial [Candidatus Thermoplasmatota archaeon]
RNKRLTEKQMINEYWKIIDAVRTRETQAQQMGFEDTGQLSFYHTLNYAFKPPTQGGILAENSNKPNQQELINITKEIVDRIQNELVIDWKNKIKVQKKIKKQIKLYLYGRYDIQVNKEKIDQLVNQLIELARRWY